MSWNPETIADGSSPQPTAPSPPAGTTPMSRRDRREAERRHGLDDADPGRATGDALVPAGLQHHAQHPPEHPPGTEIVDPVVAGLVAGPVAGPARSVPPTRAPAAQHRPAVTRTADTRRGRPRGVADTVRAWLRDPGLLPALALLGVPLVAVVVLVLLAVVLLRRLPGSPALSALLLLLVVPALTVLLLAVQRVLRRAEPSMVGAPMTPEHEPRTWAVIREVAARVGATPPEHVVVDGSPGATVARVAGGWNMVIGLPLLLELEPRQFEAVLARELARSTDLGLPAATLVSRLGERLDLVGDGDPAPVAWVLARYRDLYARVGATSEHAVEERADEVAGDLVGAQRSVESQLRILVVQLGWQTLVEEYLPLSETAEMRPLLAEGLREILAHRGERLAAQVSRGSAAMEAIVATVSGPAETGMLDDPVTLGRIEAAILLDEEPHGTWPEIAETAGKRQNAQRAQAFVTQQSVAQQSPGPDGPTLEDVLRRLETPARAEPAGGLVPPLTALAQDALLHVGLAQFLLNWTGPSQLRRRDPVSGMWVDWDGDLAVSAAAHAPAGVQQLRSWLTAAGADLNRRYDVRRPAAAPAPVSAPVSRAAHIAATAPSPPPHAVVPPSSPAAPPSSPAGPSSPPPPAQPAPTSRRAARESDGLTAEEGSADARAHVSGAGDVELLGPYPVGSVDVLVYPGGLLLHPVPQPTLQDRTRALIGRPGDVQQRLAEIAEVAGDHPEQARSGWWIDLRDVTAATLQDRRSGFELQLRTGDGSATNLRQRATSQLRGDPVGDLRRLLPGS